MADGEVRLQMGGLWEAYGASPTAGAIVLPSLAPAMAPEVGKGATMPSLRSDVYAVGVLLFELLTGRKPYAADTALATAMRHSTEPTPRVRGLNPSVPVVVDEIVAKAMDKEPERRYANAGELAADLRLVQDALRFGRTLSWPLRPVNAPAPPTKASGRGKAAPTRVAPKMSAIRDEEPEESYGKPERDVPAWASLGLALVVCVAVSLLAVYFVLNLNRPRLVTVPNVRDLTIGEARLSMDKLKLSVRAGDKVPDDRIEVDHVLETDPPSGTRVREETSVTAALSAGPAQIKAPDLTGMTPDDARSRLEKMGLRLADEPEKKDKPGAKDGTILSQEPKANAPIEREGQVRVVVQDASLPPPTINRYEYTVNVDLVDLQDPERVKIDVEDVDGKRTVQNRRRRPGDQFEVRTRARGDQAVFRIYYGDRLVKTITEKSDGASTETDAVNESNMGGSATHSPLRLAPSILSFDLTALRDAVPALEAAGADVLHLDVMDGQFVPPITFGDALVKPLRPPREDALRGAPDDAHPRAAV